MNTTTTKVIVFLAVIAFGWLMGQLIDHYEGWIEVVAFAGIGILAGVTVSRLTE